MTARITSGQKKQLVRFGEDAITSVLDDCGLDKDRTQLVIARGGEFADLVAQAARAALADLSTPQDFSDEEISSSYGYPARYAPKPLEQQVAILRGYWPKLEPGRRIVEMERLPLAAGAEALFAVPRWQKLAGTYNDALAGEVLPAIGRSRTFHNYREGQLGTTRLRQHEKTVRLTEALAAQQDGDILVVQAQFGLLHRGRSVRRARGVFQQHEFGLGAFHTGCMLLTHPERLATGGELWVDCAGDEYDPGGDDQFVRAPYFCFDDGRVEFSTSWFGCAYDICGSTSGFLPQ